MRVTGADLEFDVLTDRPILWSRLEAEGLRGDNKAFWWWVGGEGCRVERRRGESLFG